MFDDEICDKQKAHESQSRRSDRRSDAASNFGDNDPDSDATEVQREAVAQFASLCRGSGEEFLEGSDLLPGLLARLPGWRSSGVLLEILRKGRSPVTLCFDEHDLLCRPAISLRKITDNHYRAIVDGEEVELGANGNSLFYAVWYALKDGVSTETRQQIYGDYSPSDMFGAADFFRNAIADYALSHEEEVGYKLSHTQLLATDNGKPQKEKSHSTDKQEEHADLAASWSDYVPFSLKEIARILFHSGKSLSATFGWSVLTAQGLGALNQWLPVPYLPLRIYLLYDALLNRREFFDAFLNLLSFLPYHALASDHFLFDIADAARQIYHPLLSGIEDLPPYFWTSVATLALVAHYAVYARLNIDQPQTRIGQTLTRLLQQLRHVPQLYGLLETINSATPSSALDEDGNMKITPAEIRKTRLERKALKAAFLSRVASSSQPDAQSGNSPVNTNTGQQQQISTSRELVWMPAETIANTPSPGFNLSIGAESTASTLIGPRRAAESDSEYFALAALSALLDVTHELKQENAEGSHERSSSQIPDGYALSAPEATAFSAASGTDSLVTPGRATVAALYVSSPVARRAILAGVAMVAIAAVTTYLVQLGLTIPGESDYDEAEILQPDAQPFSQETPGNNTEMQTSNFKWLYLKGRNLACVRHWIETQLDHEFFLDALPFIFSPENKNTDEKSEKEFYKNTVRIAGGDFIRDVHIPIPNLKLLFGQVELKTILSGYLRLYKEIYDLSIAYSVHGRLTDGKKIVINSHIGIEMTERLSRYSDLHYDDHVYALIDENEFDFQNPRAYGLSIILNFHKKDEILHLDTVVEHPFIQLRNEDDFVDYANRRGAEWNLQTLCAR